MRRTAEEKRAEAAKGIRKARSMESTVLGPPAATAPAASVPERDIKLKRDPAGGLSELTAKERKKEAHKAVKEAQKKKKEEDKVQRKAKRSSALSWIW